MSAHSRLCILTLVAATACLFSGCGGASQWEITVENKSSLPCSFYVEMGYANAGSQGNARNSVDLAAGEDSMFLGDIATTIHSVKVVRGEEEHVLQPNVEIRPGMRYVIVATTDGKVEAAFNE